MKRFFILAIIAVKICIPAAAQSFDEFFKDSTLRVDYILAGDIKSQSIYLKEVLKKDKWAGRRNNLTKNFLNGNGQIKVYDHNTGKLIYVHTFSSLFQEWVLTEEATRVKKAFEVSYNLPFPRSEVDIKFTLTNNHNKVVAELSHTITPQDILIREIGDNGIPTRMLMQNGNLAECVDLVFVAEGYTEAEMGKFYKDCDRAMEALFTHEPFATLKSRFNVLAVASSSKQSGPSQPLKHSWTETALGSNYSTFYMDRYLTTSRDHRLNDILSGVPFEHIIILVNTPVYGGGGIYNQWMTVSSDHPTFKQVLVHEFGHSYAGLGDEYDYGDQVEPPYPADTEPWEPNITTLKDFDSKWKDMVGKDGVGVFEGAGYMTKGCYRPVEKCRMKVNNVKDFCPVCTRAINRITEFYTK